MKCWKVVERRTDGTLVSAVATGYGRVEYEPFKTSRAPAALAKLGYHLMAFVDYNAAVGFLDRQRAGDSSDNSIELWTAEGYEEVDLPEVFLEMQNPGKDYRWWRDRITGRINRGTLNIFAWPSGTRMFKAIYLLEKFE